MINVVTSQRLQGKTMNMEVVEEFESRRHKAVTFLVARNTQRSSGLA